tara:strand:+ start:527 stop:1180 length:654 start_codon:yes stop_codon:yes gene_type:complete
MTLTTINLAALGDTINLGTEVTGLLPLANGGTNATSIPATNLASSVTGTLATGNGGTGSTSFSPGKLLQTQSATFTSGVTSVTSDSFTATEVTDQITPSASGSKILVIVNASLSMSEGSGSGVKFKAGLYRQINGGGYSRVYAGQSNSYGGLGQNDTWSSIGASFPTTFTFIDSPNTTNAVDYKLYIGLLTASGQGDNVNTGSSSMERSVSLIEIGA